MKCVLVTGMSGTGKSSVIRELVARGYKAVDTDYGDWKELVDLPANARPSGVSATQDLVWREDRIKQLLASEEADVLFIAGTVSNQSKFYGRFSDIVLLTASTSVTAERLATRTNNPYGRSPGELERVMELKRIVEPMLRAAATVEVDTSSTSLDQVVDKICRATTGDVSGHSSRS